MTEETKKKISETIKRKWQDEKYREKVVNSHKHKLPEEWKENIRKATNNMTEETKSKMSKSQKKIRNGHFILDFWLPEYQLAIECNGEYWHNLPKRKERDKKLEKYIIDKGKDILWLWENDIKKENFDISDYLEI